MKKYYGITITEIWENDPGDGKIFKRHKETHVFNCTVPEGRFDIDLILKALLDGSKRTDMEIRERGDAEIETPGDSLIFRDLKVSAKRK